MRGLIWILVIAWIAAVAYYGYITTPVMSLDLGNDAATRAAYDQAVAMHAAWFAGLALIPPLLAWIVARMMAR